MLKRLFKRTLIQILPNLYKAWSFRKLNSFSWKNVKELYLDPELLLLQNLLVNNEDVFFDIGANKGEFCFMAEKLISPENIYSFEPQPYLFVQLKRMFPQIRLFSIAISDKISSSSFKVPIIGTKADDTLGTLETDHIEKNETAHRLFLVQTTTLDAFVQKNNVKKITAIKIDVEGHETKVIAGAQQSIQQFKPHLMVEIEQRHHPNQSMASLLEPYLKMAYNACYFDFKQMQVVEITDVNQIVQNLSDWGTRNYINNFIFIHNKQTFLSFIQQVNEKTSFYKT